MASCTEDENFIEETWAKILPNLDLLIDNETRTLKTLTQLHSDVYQYCTILAFDKNRGVERSDRGDIVKNKLRGAPLYFKLKEYLTSYCNDLIQESADLTDEDLLRFYATEYAKYDSISNALNSAFNYLNKSWIKRSLVGDFENPEIVYRVVDLAIITWKDVIFQRYNSRIVNMALKLIDRQRRGEIIDAWIIQWLTCSYCNMGIYLDGENHDLILYQEHFEKPFLENSRNFYELESLAFLKDNPVTEYLKWVDQRLSEEANNVAECVDSSSKFELIKTVEWTLFQCHLKEFCVEFQELLKLDKNDDMKLLYSLVNRNPKDLDMFILIFKEYVHSQGLFCIEKCGEAVKSDSVMFMDAILNVYKKYVNLISTAFDNNVKFLEAFETACKKFVNQNFTSTAPNPSRKASELLAKYCNNFLKQSNSSKKEDMDQAKENVMIVFKLIFDKDVFQDCYMKLLTKRLINQTSNKSCETEMVLKLKEAAGDSFTSKFEKMLSDVAVSMMISKEFDESKPKADELDFNVMVLRFGTWPFRNTLTYTVPSELDKCITDFSTFYKSKHAGRKLIWMYNLSKGEVVTTSFKKCYTFQSSNMEITILMLFNISDTLSLAQIHKQSAIEMEWIKQIIQILLKVKIIVTSEENVENLTPDTKVTVNKAFNNKNERINIDLPLKQIVKPVQEIADKNIDEKRKFVIQAAIVRIMKARKSLKHGELISEVLKSLSGQFQPKLSVIENLIKVLIEKEYLERNSREKAYTYLP